MSESGHDETMTDSYRRDRDSTAPVELGEVINEKYRVDRVLGSGGMGLVVEALHLGLDERVALKFLHREAMASADIVQRFELEAKAASKLKSEFIAKVTDVDKRTNGTPFMVMEYLDGRDLAAVVDEGGPLTTQQAVEYTIQACEGLSEAHARGIVHRDIKPENLFLVTREDGWKSVKILDFGISKVPIGGPTRGISKMGTNSGPVTVMDGALMGSPYYMSPEQFRAQGDVDHRVDIWALGAVLFELLTGKTAFEEVSDITQLIPKIISDPNRQLLELRSDAPPGLQDVINKCLQKDPEKRYKNAAELAIALLPFAPKRARVVAERASSLARAAGHDVVGIQSLPPPPMSSLSPDVNSLPAAAVSQEEKREPKKKAPVALIAVGAALLFGVGAFVAMREKKGTGESQEAKPAATETAHATVGAQVTPPPEVSTSTAATVAAAQASEPAVPDATPGGRGAAAPRHRTPKSVKSAGGAQAGDNNEIRLTR